MPKKDKNQKYDHKKAPLTPPDIDKVEQVKDNEKQKDLEANKVDNKGKAFTTNKGLKMAEDEFSLKSGRRGPTLIEDFHLREKIMHFDHERIPERIVHARGVGAHGVFKCTKDMSEYTKASLFTEEGKETSLFTRISTVAGFRGSTDTPRDVRGFALKFYTDEGNYDIVGNNIPVFFIQDAIKFPDFVHSVKPEPDTEVPQAQSAHDTFWDFVSRNQESAHTVMWAMSDRAIPLSLRMMDGFAVHTFRFVNAEGKGTFVRFQWNPQLGVHSRVWDETLKVSGNDPDSQRKDLYDAIDEGNYPVWDFCVQLLPEEKEFDYPFDILDPTKVWPEEDIPKVKIGEITLNRNVDNYFAETEQVAFNPGNVVPGIDFSNDPLLQGRLFSYTDTQLLRLGGPNFAQIPINRPISEVHNNQRDGWHQDIINKGPVSYHKSAIDDQSPYYESPENGGYEHYQEKIDGRAIKDRDDSFRDHFSQATSFYKSLSKVEQEHIKNAFSFELSKVKRPEIRQNVVDMFANVDKDMATEIAKNVGADTPNAERGFDPVGIKASKEALEVKMPEFSQENTIFKPDTLKVGIYSDSDDDFDFKSLVKSIKNSKAKAEIIQADLQDTKDGVMVTHRYETIHPVLEDALIIVVPEKPSHEFSKNVGEFASETFKHYKPIWIIGDASDILSEDQQKAEGVMVTNDSKDIDKFIENLTKQRFWDRDGSN
ncbi:MAG: catalase [Anaerococcus sp.]|uniref:catalase n=1 Tax=Anaerococcus sp. TaxID=1872515 RepID=UPI00291378DE|nr:catalase [Anaerococcus sp.]MDU4025722.1 catalase [Anaerococcus sp.]